MKKYKILLADPPWSYRNKNTGGSFKSGSSAKYKTMSVEEICNMRKFIDEISDKDSVLFLWAIVPLLPEGLEVLNAWGYKYKTSLFWRKIKSLGMGFWFRGIVEVLLMGVKGKVKAFRIQKGNVIQSKVRKHSRKPDEFYELIEMSGLEPKIELFARNRRNGWSAFGDEVESDINLLEEVMPI